MHVFDLVRLNAHIHSDHPQAPVAAAASSHSPRNKSENVCDQQQQASTAHGTNVRMSVDSEVEHVSGRSPHLGGARRFR